MSLPRRLVALGDVFVFLVTFPFALAGLAWLVLVTDMRILYSQRFIFLLLAVLTYIFSRLNYFIIADIRTDRYGSAEGSLAGTIQLAGVFLLGPSALWISVTSCFITFYRTWHRATSKPAHWSNLRNFAMELATNTLAYLVALSFYQKWGGVYPFPDLSIASLIPALGALLVYFLVVVLIWAVYTIYAIWVQHELAKPAAVKPIIRFLLVALGFPFLALPFAVLLAGLYAQNGLMIFLFLVIGLILVAYMTRRLSWAIEISRQKSRQLEQLEQLERDILNSPPDASGLPDVLHERVPTMFPSGKVAIWLSGDRFLHKHPDDWSLEIEPIWNWSRGITEPRAFITAERLPWMVLSGEHSSVVLAPILEVENSVPIGCIYIELRSLAQPWDRNALVSLYPAIQSLGAQVASALHRAQVYRANLEYQSAVQELEFAGRIQASFLPNEMPSLDGWEFAVALLSARDTSGDYFDFIPLGDDKLGILIADVADKGVGAALYMALSRTLIRTYALEFEMQPDIVFYSTNERILNDARANLFVTAFYGILDQKSGILTYSNAGHNPPFLLSYGNEEKVHALTVTGMPIGVDEDTYWELETIRIGPGDVLVMYTDGIPDAQNGLGEFFKERRMVEIAQEKVGTSAEEIQKNILSAVQAFVGEAPQFDDITLLVVMRDRE